MLTRRRSPQAWLDSLKRHALRISPKNRLRGLAYGRDYPHGYEAEHLAFYEQHYRDVRTFFSARDASHLLLEVCWDDGDGWAELCSFFDLPIPDQPFPHENKGEHTIDPAVKQENLALIEAQLAALARTEAPPLQPPQPE